MRGGGSLSRRQDRLLGENAPNITNLIFDKSWSVRSCLVSPFINVCPLLSFYHVMGCVLLKMYTEG